MAKSKNKKPLHLTTVSRKKSAESNQESSNDCVPTASLKQGKQRRWIRRAGWSVVVLLTLVLILRIALWLSLPWLLENTVRDHGLDASYESLSLSLLSGDMEVWHLVVVHENMTEPLADMEYCRADVSTLSLLAGRLIVRRLEIDGIDVTLKRNADGSFQGLESVVHTFRQQLNTQDIAEVQDPLQDQDNQVREIILSPPFQLDALRLQHIRVRLRDETLEPAFEALLDANLRLSDLGSDKRGTRFQLLVSCEPVLNQLLIEGTATSTETTLQAQLKCAGKGLQTAALAPYLQHWGIYPNEERVDFGYSGSVSVAALDPNEHRPGDPNQHEPTQHEPILSRVIQCQMNLKNAYVTADDHDAVRLEEATVSLDMPGPHHVIIHNAKLSDGQIHLWRRETEAWDGAGLSVVPKNLRQALETVGGPDPVTVEETIDPNGSEDKAPQQWALEKLSLQNIGIHLHDETTSIPAHIALRVRDLSIDGLQSGSDPNHALAPLRAHMSAPGICKDFTVTGQVNLVSPRKTLNLQLSAQEVNPVALKPYLDPLGIVSEHRLQTTVSCGVVAALKPGAAGAPLNAEIEIQDVVIADDEPLFSLEALNIQEIEYQPEAISIGSIALSGQRLAVHYDDTGLGVLGFRFNDTPVKTTEKKPSGTIAGQNDKNPNGQDLRELLLRMPRIEISQLSCLNTALELVDTVTLPGEPTRLNGELTLDLRNFVFDVTDTNAPLAPAQWKTHLSIPRIVDDMTVQGTFNSSSQGLDTGLSFNMRGLQGELLRDYLRPFNIEPAFNEGKLTGTAKMQVQITKPEMPISVVCQNLSFTEGSSELFSLEELNVQELRLQDSAIQANSIEIHHPLLTASRDDPHKITVAGFRWLPPAQAYAEPAATSKTPVRLDRVSLDEGRIHWLDNTLESPLDFTIIIDADLQQFALTEDANPTQVALQVQIPGIADQIELKGEIVPGLTRAGCRLGVQAQGLHTKPLAGYFSSVYPNLHSAYLDTDVRFSFAKVDTEQLHIEGLIENLALGERNADQPLLRLDRAKVAIPMLDPNRIIVDSIILQGMEGVVARESVDTLNIMGLAVKSDTPSLPVTAKAKAKRENKSPEPLSNGQTSKRHPARYAPDVTIHAIDLNIKKLVYSDLVRVNAAPVIISNVTIGNTQPLQLLGLDAQSKPAIQLLVKGSITPILDSLSAQIQLAPFAAEPNMVLDLDVQGIHGQGLTEVLPELASSIDGTALKAGRLRGQLHLTVNPKRRNVLDWDLSKPFSGMLMAKGFQFTDADENDTLLGLAELHIEVPVIDLNRRYTRMKRVELMRPQCRIVRQHEGIRLLNMVFRGISSSEDDSNQLTGLSESTDNARASARHKVSRSGRPLIEVDQFLINGLDLSFTDVTTSPAMNIPLQGLDFELRGFSTTTPATPKPVRLNMIVTAGEVALPLRNSKTIAANPQGSTDSLPTSKLTYSETEQTPLFQEVTATGRFTLGPHPNGWLKAGVSGLELRNFKALAEQQKVTLNNGLLDASIDVRLRDDDKVRMRTRWVFSDLSMAEPADGFLTRLLQLPTSLDTVLFILRGPDETIRLPIDFTVGQKGISTGQITKAVVGATTSVITTAVAGSPLRAAGAMGKLLGGDAPADVNEAPIVIVYEPGLLAPPKDQNSLLKELTERLKQEDDLTLTLRHQLGQQDLAYTERLVNPTSGLSHQLLKRLKREKKILVDGRSELLNQVRTAYAIGSKRDLYALKGRLRAINQQLGHLEQGIDRTIDLTQPATKYAKRRRTRDGVLAIAQERLNALYDMLVLQSQSSVRQQRIKRIAPSLKVDETINKSRIVISLARTKVL